MSASRRPGRFRPLVPRGDSQLHKSAGASSDVLCSPAFSPSGSQHLCGRVCGQHDCSSLPEESGRYQISCPELDSSGSSAVGGAPLCDSSPTVYYGPQQCSSGRPISPKPNSGLRVDFETLGISSASEEMASVNRPICNLSQSPLHTIFFSLP